MFVFHICRGRTSLCLQHAFIQSVLTCTIRAPSAERCQQPPEWAVLRHINCLSQCKVVGFQVILYSLKPSQRSWSINDTPRGGLWITCQNQYQSPGSLFQPSGGSTNTIFLTFILSSIHRAICLKRERCLDWTVDVKLSPHIGCHKLVPVPLDSQQPDSICRHHWLRVNFLCILLGDYPTFPWHAHLNIYTVEENGGHSVLIYDIFKN